MFDFYSEFSCIPNLRDSFVKKSVASERFPQKKVLK